MNVAGLSSVGPPRAPGGVTVGHMTSVAMTPTIPLLERDVCNKVPENLVRF